MFVFAESGHAVVAGDEAAVEQGESEFDVIGIVAIAFLEAADHGAGAQAKVPHGLIAATDGLAILVFDSLVGTKVKEVDIGVREEFLAAEAADGHHCQPGWERTAALEPPERL